MKLRFDVVPTPASRPRVSRWSTYYGKNHTEFVKTMKTITDHANVVPFEGQIYAKADFYVPMPRTWSKKKKEAHIGKYCDNNKDLDNYQKLLFDCMNGIYFKDDRQLVMIRARKYWSTGSGHIECELTKCG